MRLRFSERARAHVAAIKEFWGSRSQEHAEHIGAGISATTRVLRDLPNIGHVGQAEGTREIVVRGLPYAVVYEVSVGDQDEVMVLAVFHTAQDRRISLCENNSAFPSARP